MKTDRELLELAARAADISVVWGELAGCFFLSEGSLQPWDPLRRDGDALRLAVKLNMLCDFGSHGVLVEAKNGQGPHTEVDDYRRAIVRAAAAIGEQMH